MSLLLAQSLRAASGGPVYRQPLLVSGWTVTESPSAGPQDFYVNGSRFRSEVVVNATGEYTNQAEYTIPRSAFRYTDRRVLKLSVDLERISDAVRMVYKTWITRGSGDIIVVNEDLGSFDPEDTASYDVRLVLPETATGFRIEWDQYAETSTDGTYWGDATPMRLEDTLGVPVPHANADFEDLTKVVINSPSGSSLGVVAGLAKLSQRYMASFISTNYVAGDGCAAEYVLSPSEVSVAPETDVTLEVAQIDYYSLGPSSHESTLTVYSTPNADGSGTRTSLYTNTVTSDASNISATLTTPADHSAFLFEVKTVATAAATHTAGTRIYGMAIYP